MQAHNQARTHASTQASEHTRKHAYARTDAKAHCLMTGGDLSLQQESKKQATSSKRRWRYCGEGKEKEETKNN